jgi:hypothetical protein
MHEHLLPRNFIYLDGDGIERLYSQVSDDNPLERTSERQKHQEEGLQAGIESGGLITRLLSVKAGVSRSTGQSETIVEKSEVRRERKLLDLTHYLAIHHPTRYFRDLGSAAEQCLKIGGFVYIDIQDRFDVPEAVAGGFPISDALAFERRKQHDDRDDYWRNASRYTFVMMASVDKLTGANRGYVSPTSHLGVYLRRYGGRKVPLGVFGELSPLPDECFQIKPFAIWRS